MESIQLSESVSNILFVKYPFDMANRSFNGDIISVVTELLNISAIFVFLFLDYFDAFSWLLWNKMKTTCNVLNDKRLNTNKIVTKKIFEKRFYNNNNNDKNPKSISRQVIGASHLFNLFCLVFSIFFNNIFLSNKNYATARLFKML